MFLVVLPFSLRHLSIGFGIALFVGAALMPFTQRIEARNLADREQDTDLPPPTGA